MTTDFGRSWNVETNIGWVLIRLLAPGERTLEGAPQSARRSLARFELLASRSQAGLHALRELWALLRALPMEDEQAGNAARDTESTEWRELESMLDHELTAGHVELELIPPFHDSLRERAEYEPPPPPSRALPPPEPETTFIAVRLIDQKGRPVVGREWTIELPDGSQHAGVTDFDGWARVRDFKQDGTAKVCFPDFDELDSDTRNAAERVIIPVDGGDPDQRFLELTFVRPNGEPISGLRFSVTCQDGTIFKSKTDDDGFAMIFGLTSETALVTVQKRAANAAS